MSEKGHHIKMSREERLATNLRANLRRRKQASRKSKSTPETNRSKNSPTHDKGLP